MSNFCNPMIGKIVKMNPECFEQQKYQFEKWLNLNNKSNSSVLSECEYTSIIKYLKDKNDGKTGYITSRNIQRRIKSNKFKLIDYPPLGLKDILCAPTKCNTENNLRESSPFGNYSRVASTKDVFFCY
nr:uncharacterized protein LOC105846419 [Hydra vulgaris]